MSQPTDTDHPDRLCVEVDCSQPLYARGLCESHYGWHRRHGLLVRLPRATAAEYVAQRISTAPESGCWHWTGPAWPNGYGIANHNGRTYMAHRFVYELHRGSIPEGLVLDHLCRNVICVNPDHVEPVTNAENLRRGMSPQAKIVRSGKCLHGHEMQGENLYVSPAGIRKCRTCMKANRRARYLRDKAAQGIPDFKPKGGCDEPGCERPHYGRGLCNMHWQRRYVAPK